MFICFLLIEFKAKHVYVEKIDLDLKEKEIGIILYNDNNLNFILKVENNYNNLFLLKYNKSLNKVLNVFNISKIDVLISNEKNIKADKYLYLDKDFSVKNIMKKDSLVTIDVYDYKFCIVNGKTNTDKCSFIYMNYNDDIILNNDVKVVFYSDKMTEKVKEDLYTKWIDTYELNKNSYTIIKINEENYNILNIPK